MHYFPPLFLSHGSPNMALHDTPVRKFMSGLGTRYPKPKAIIACSAHFETKGAAVVTDAQPEMIYDFRGFERELYEFEYPAKGHPELAERVASLIGKADIPVERMAKRGFDHGTWVPLSLTYPQADIPIVQLSIDPDETPEFHYKVGQALSELPFENIAIIGTGNITHNLPALFSKGKDPHIDANIKNWVDEFLGWFDAQLIAGETHNLLKYREAAPFAAENHPTDEHLLPIYVAMGAAGSSYQAEKIHQSFTYDFLAMDAWAFHSSKTA